MDDFFGDYFSDPYIDYIVPPDYPNEPRPAITQTPSAPSYETPPWLDTINRAIERASQVATIEVGGYPPYPSYPNYPSPQPSPMPGYGSGPSQQQPGGVHLSTNTLMLLVGGFLLFTLGKRGR